MLRLSFIYKRATALSVLMNNLHHCKMMDSKLPVIGLKALLHLMGRSRRSVRSDVIHSCAESHLQDANQQTVAEYAFIQLLTLALDELIKCSPSAASTYPPERSLTQFYQAPQCWRTIKLINKLLC